MAKLKRNKLYNIAFLALLLCFAIAIVEAAFDLTSKLGESAMSKAEPSKSVELAQANRSTHDISEEDMDSDTNDEDEDPDAIDDDEGTDDKSVYYMDPDSAYSYHLGWSNACDTIIGQFRKGVVDTLVREPIWFTNINIAVAWSRLDDEWWWWRIRSLKGSVADIYFMFRLWVDYCNVGDLDGNGTDELCVHCSNYSNWTWYNVITYHEGEWHRLTESLFAHMAAMPWPDHIEEYVSKSDRPGYIKAKVTKDIFYNDDNDWRDWMGVECVDSLVKIKLDDGVYDASRSSFSYL